MPANVESMFSVRQMPWHQEGIILGDTRGPRAKPACWPGWTIFRLDGHDPAHPERSVPPHPAFTADVLADVIRQVTSAT